MTTINKTTGMTDAQFASYFANPSSISKYSLSEGIKRTKLRNDTISSLLVAGIEYEQAATLADQIVIETFGK